MKVLVTVLVTIILNFGLIPFLSSANAFQDDINRRTSNEKGDVIDMLRVGEPYENGEGCGTGFYCCRKVV